jgi:hypothetical protein
LYLLRYIESPSKPYPVAKISVAEGSMEIIPAPGHDVGLLAAPGQATVIVSHGPAVFEIEVSSASRGASLDANLSLDLLAQGAAEEKRIGRISEHRDANRHDFGRPMASSVALDIGAHVSRRGDVRAGSGEWIAGPSDILPIEGLSIDTRRYDLCIDIRVQTVRSQGQWSRWHQNGQFAGSRQRAEAITAIALLLHGDGSEDFVMSAEVMQLGTAVRKSEGREIEFLGYDPIVGFRLELKQSSTLYTPRVEGGLNKLNIFRAQR